MCQHRSIIDNRAAQGKCFCKDPTNSSHAAAAAACAPAAQHLHALYPDVLAYLRWKSCRNGPRLLCPPADSSAPRAQVRAFMPAQGFENCGNATLVAARAVPSPLGKSASSASVPTLDLASATFLELQFAAFGKCVPRPRLYTAAWPSMSACLRHARWHCPDLCRAVQQVVRPCLAGGAACAGRRTPVIIAQI